MFFFIFIQKDGKGKFLSLSLLFSTFQFSWWKKKRIYFCMRRKQSWISFSWRLLLEILWTKYFKWEARILEKNKNKTKHECCLVFVFFFYYFVWFLFFISLQKKTHNNYGHPKPKNRKKKEITTMKCINDS